MPWDETAAFFLRCNNHPELTYTSGEIRQDMGILGNSIISSPCGVSATFMWMALTPAFCGPLPCPDPMFAVEANDDTMTLPLCTMATEIRDTLEVCGLKQSRVLTVEITDELSHPLANRLAYFDCEYDVIRIADPSTWDALMEEQEVPPQGIDLRYTNGFAVAWAQLAEGKDRG